MTIELWDWLEHLNVVVGADFPEADEDALWRCSRAWTDAASELRALVPFAASAGATVHGVLDGDTGDAFGRLWGPFHADRGYLATLAEHCERLAAACDQTATDVEYAKLEYIGALVVLGSALAALTVSLIAGGVSALGMPAAIAFAQFSIRLIITRLISSILIGVAFVGGMDVLTQLVQLFDGHRHEWDWSRTLRSVEDGAIFGAVGGVGFLGLGRLVSPTIGRAAGRGLMMGTAGGTGLVGGTVAPLLHGERPGLTDIAIATVASGVGGFAAVHRGGKGHGRPADDVVLDARTVAAVPDDALRQPTALHLERSHDEPHGHPDLTVPTERVEQAPTTPLDRAVVHRSSPDPDAGRSADRPGDRPAVGPVSASGDLRPVDPNGPRTAIADPRRPVDPAPAPRPVDNPADGSAAGSRSAAAPVPAAVDRSADATAPPTRTGPDPAQVAPAPARTEVGVVAPVVAGPHPPGAAVQHAAVQHAAVQHPALQHPALQHPAGARADLVPPGHDPVMAARSGADPGGPGWLGPGTGAPDPSLIGPDSAGVVHLLDRARSAEPALTAIVQEVADRAGGALVGLDERLKTADSISDKLARQLRTHPADSLATGLAEITDTVRYTVVFPDETYASGAQAAIDDLAGRLRPVRDRRSWDNSAGYLGVNSVWYHEGTGTTFEVQLHTPDSFAAKSVTHGMYKVLRVSDIDLPDLQADHDARFAAVRVPDGAHSVGIPDSLSRHRPTVELPADIRSRPADRAPDEFPGPAHSPDAFSADAGATDGTPGSGIEDFLDLPPDPRHSVTDAEAVALVRQHVVQTDAGLAFYPVHDQMRDFARAMRPADGLLTLDLHGSRIGFQVEDGLLTPEQLATALRDLRAAGVLDLPEGAGLKLVACDTAFGGEHSPAARLARALGVEVVAPDEPVWTTVDGYEFVSSPTLVQGNLLPAWPPDGAWHRFSASGREIPLGRDPSGRQPRGIGTAPGGHVAAREELDPP